MRRAFFHITATALSLRQLQSSSRNSFLMPFKVKKLETGANAKRCYGVKIWNERPIGRMRFSIPAKKGQSGAKRIGSLSASVGAIYDLRSPSTRWSKLSQTLQL